MSNWIPEEVLNEVREIQENRMSNERHIDTFEHWWLGHYGHLSTMPDVIREVARIAWDYQQETIDKLTAELDNIEGY